MKDFNLSFNRNRFSNDITQLDSKHAIAQKILTVLNLSPGDVTYKEYLFAGMKSLLGENVSNVNTSIMKEQIDLILINHVPEVELIDIKIIPNFDEQKYIITLYYNIVNDVNSVEQTIVIQAGN